MFFAGEPELLGQARHGRHTDPEPALGGQVLTEFGQGGIGMCLDQSAHEAKGGLITTRTPAAGVGARCDVPSHAASAQERLDTRLADAK